MSLKTDNKTDSGTLHYLTEVLGIRSLLIPGADFHVEPAKAQVKQTPHYQIVRLLHEDFKDPKTFALFEKMQLAMNPPEGAEMHASIDLATPNDGSLVLIFGLNVAQKLNPNLCESGTWISIDQNRYYVTHSPNEALNQPELKKVIWRDMKRVISAAGWENA